jgi:hypothetical protein
VVESDSFRDLMKCLDPRYQVPSRKHLSSVLLQERHDLLLANIKETLHAVTNVSITMDLWTNRQMRAFSGITAHYITDWKLHSVVLGCIRFKGRHTAYKIY